MADSSFIIDFVARFSDAIKGLDSFAKEAKKATKKIEDDFSQIKLAAFTTGLNQGIQLVEKLANALAEPIRQASAYESALNGLTVALELSGLSSLEATEQLADYANQIQKTTKFSDDAVISTASLIQSLANLPTDQLKRATKATLDLSTALRIDLDSAARLVGKAAEGNVSAFKKFGISVNEGKDNAETFANALTQLEKKFGGTSEKAVNTYAGATEQLKNSIDDVVKGFGLLIIQNPDVISAIKTTAQSIQSLSGTGEKLFKILTDTGKALVFLADVISLPFDSLPDDISKPFVRLTDSTDDAIKSAKSYRSELNRQNSDLLKQKSIDEGFQKQLEERAKAQEKLIADRPKLIEQAQKGADVRRGLKEISEAQEAIAVEGGKAFVKEIARAAIANQQQIAAVVSPVISGVAQGAAGVAQTFATLAASTGPLGQIAGQLIQFLAQGPEAVRAQIQAFIDNIPLVIDAIVQSIPVVIDVLAANAPKIALALSNQMPFIATTLAFSLAQQAPNIAKSFIDGLIAEAGRLVTAIADGVKGAIGQATGLGGGGIIGKVLNPVASIGKKLKFADGGVIPGGFPNDTFPAQLTSGEGVVPNDTMRRLDQYLMRSDGGGGGSSGGGTTIIKLVIGEQELANVLLNLNRQGFRT